VRVSVDVQIDSGAVRGLNQPGGVVYEAVMRGSARVRDLAKDELGAHSRIDTGRLRQSVEREVYSEAGGVRGRVGTDVEYARYVHEGTASPIVPRRAKVLRFRPKGGGAFVFAPQVRGTRETGNFTPFLVNALKRMTTRDLT